MLLVASALAALSTVTAPPAAPPRLDVLLTCSQTSMPEELVEAVAREAHAIWAPYLDLRVTIARVAVPAGPLVAMLVDAPAVAGEGDRSALGAIVFGDRSVPANRIVLSVSGARRLAEAAWSHDGPLVIRPRVLLDRFVVHALARALGHEIGHFILRSPEHESQGLMRARFTTTELQDDTLKPYALTASDRSRLASTLAERTAKVQPQSTAPSPE